MTVADELAAYAAEFPLVRNPLEKFAGFLIGIHVDDKGSLYSFFDGSMARVSADKKVEAINNG